MSRTDPRREIMNQQRRDREMDAKLAEILKAIKSLDRKIAKQSKETE